MSLVPKYRVRKRPRRESSDDFSIEEISPDDMGYDGDVDIEVLHPDQYEEPESDFEDEQALKRLWPDTDDELASRLRRLSTNRRAKKEDLEDKCRGQKRDSTQMDEEEERPLPDRTEIEISEVIDGEAAQQPPTKRRKRTNGKPPLGHRVVKKQAYEAWSDSSDKTEEAAIESSNDFSTPDATKTPSTPLRKSTSQDDYDAMEIG